MSDIVKYSKQEIQKLTNLKDMESNQISKIDFDNENTMFESAKNTFRDVSKLITPNGAILQREGGGDSVLNYVDDAVPRAILNQITPFWDFEHDEPVAHKIPTIVGKDAAKDAALKPHAGKEIPNVNSYFYTCKAKLTLHFPKNMTRVISDVGTCDVTFTNAGKAQFEMAFKGSVTDAFKRCCARLGIVEDVYGKPPKNYKHELIVFHLFGPTGVFDPKTRFSKKFYQAWQETYYAVAATVSIQSLFTSVFPSVKTKAEETGATADAVSRYKIAEELSKNCTNKTGKFDIEVLYQYISEKYSDDDLDKFEST